MKKQSMAGNIVSYAFLALLSCVFLVPFLYMVSISLASDATAFTASFTMLPTEFVFQNYTNVLFYGQVPVWLRNSVVLTAVNTVFQVFVNSLVAFAFARLRARFNRPLFIVLLSTMMVPSQVMLIPQFMLFRSLGWTNTLLPLIVPNLFGNAFYIFLLRQFIMRLPISLDEAAKIDGLGYFGIYRRIILPLIRPAMAAVAVFAVIGNWNWFFEPMIYLNDPKLYPLAIGVKIMSTTSSTGQMPMWNRIFAASMILVIPMILIYFVGQKYMFELSINAGSASLK